MKRYIICDAYSDYKEDESYLDIHELITENGFIAEYGSDAYTKYVIEEYEVQ